jgi:hypothetical protein
MHRVMKKKTFVGKRVRIIIGDGSIPEDKPNKIIGNYTGFVPKQLLLLIVEFCP